MRKTNIVLGMLILLAAAAVPAGSVPAEKAPIIGDSVQSYALAPANQAVRGMAFDDVSADAPRLFVLDENGKIFVYRPPQGQNPTADTLELIDEMELPEDQDGIRAGGARGLAYAEESRQDVLYFLNWDEHKTLDRNTDDVTSELWRFNVTKGAVSHMNLTLFPFRIGDREILDVAYSNGNIFISFDASRYLDYSLRVKRGIIKLAWNQAYDGKLEFVKHLPDSGERISHAIAFMELEGARYLWGTVGSEWIYSADAATGRGLFHFRSPGAAAHDPKIWGLAYGAEYLWVSEDGEGPDRIHKVNVIHNPDAAYEGPRILRHLTLSIESNPEENVQEAGKVYHYYSRPYDYEQLGNQGIWPSSEKVKDLSDSGAGTIKPFTYDPAGDKSSRQHMSLVEYASAPSRRYSSQYEIDLWTSRYRKFVYPHRVNRDISRLKGTDYLEDDLELYNLKNTDIYDSFFERVRDHIRDKYGIEADLSHPYWAARNCLEYIQDHYYYPSRPKRKPAAVDYENQHYDANPGSLKIDLSRNEYDKNQIIACSGTSVMLAGAMRYLGLEARWLGTGNERLPADWDTNGNGLLDEGESAGVTSGHRYSQVWLGSNYGWVCFDATPTRPDFNDFDPVPPHRPQWRFMNRAAAGHLKDRRIVFNVGSKLFRPLYRDFLYDEKRAINNDCGGDQRYNIQGRFDEPALWQLARHRLSVTNLCFITDVALNEDRSGVTWKWTGAWDKDPGAVVNVYLELIDPERKTALKSKILAGHLPYLAGRAGIDLSGIGEGSYRIVVRKVGDSETGGQSAVFNLVD
jgi:hypothetical protein